MKKLGLISLITICSIQAFAQSFYNYGRGRNAIVSIGSGTSTYFGDLKDNGDYFDAKPHLNIGLRYVISQRVSIRAESQWFKLGGDDANSDEKRIRNLSFVSNNLEIGAVGILNFLPNGLRYYQRPTINFYGFAGISYLYFNPKAEYEGKKYALQPIQTEGVKYSRSTVVIPYGIGIRCKINPFFNFVVEGGFRQTFTDYLDDVSTTYVDNSSFSDPIHAALADRRPEIGGSRKEAGERRGNSDKNDNYFILSAKIEFYLPPEILNFGSPKRPGRRYNKARNR